MECCSLSVGEMPPRFHGWTVTCFDGHALSRIQTLQQRKLPINIVEFNRVIKSELGDINLHLSEFYF